MREGRHFISFASCIAKPEDIWAKKFSSMQE